MAENYEMPIFWPCLTCYIFYRERHRKSKFSLFNDSIVLYKAVKYRCCLLIIAELTDRQTCEFRLTYWDFHEMWLKKTQPSQWSISEIFQHPNEHDVLYELQWNLEINPNGYRENCCQIWHKITKFHFSMGIFKPKFLEFWSSEFSKIFRERRGINRLSIREI